MGDPVQHDLVSDRLGLLNCRLLRISVPPDVQLRNFPDPAAIGLAVEFNGQLYGWIISSYSRGIGDLADFPGKPLPGA